MKQPYHKQVQLETIFLQNLHIKFLSFGHSDAVVKSLKKGSWYSWAIFSGVCMFSIDWMGKLVALNCFRLKKKKKHRLLTNTSVSAHHQHGKVRAIACEAEDGGL